MPIMVISLRRFLRRMLFVLLMILLTVTIFSFIRIASEWFRVPDPYAKPQGYAVKAFETTQDAESDATFAERLRWFYLLGE
jgi:hypothetical protein